MLAPFGENFNVVEKNILHDVYKNRDFHHGSSAIVAKANFEKVKTWCYQCERAEDDVYIKYHGYQGIFSCSWTFKAGS